MNNKRECMENLVKNYSIKITNRFRGKACHTKNKERCSDNDIVNNKATSESKEHNTKNAITTRLLILEHWGIPTGTFKK